MISECTDGSITFKLYRPDASEVTLSGSFNGWARDALHMKKNSDGWWSCTCILEKGDYQFQYLVDGWDWVADFAAHGVERNEYGTWRSLLTVEPAPAVPMIAMSHVPIAVTIESKPFHTSKRKTQDTHRIPHAETAQIRTRITGKAS